MTTLRPAHPLLALLLAGLSACAVPASEDEPTATSGSALVASKYVTYLGRNPNWFDPTNWSTGRVPGPGEDVLLEGSDDVLIDPAASGATGKVVFQDLHVRGAARFEARGGVILETRHQVLEERGQIVIRSSGDVGESLIVADDAAGGIIWNPTSQSKLISVLRSSITVDVGLGGTTPASVTRDATGELVLHAGRGHYSTMEAETLELGGHLQLSTYYGFDPQPGDTFQILTADTRVGEFTDLPEGSFVGCTEANVCLRISYQGGDGNDVVLTAVPVEPRMLIGLLVPAVQKVIEAVP
jgi:hypothetical protein